MSAIHRLDPTNIRGDRIQYMSAFRLGPLALRRSSKANDRTLIHRFFSADSASPRSPCRMGDQFQRSASCTRIDHLGHIEQGLTTLGLVDAHQAIITNTLDKFLAPCPMMVISGGNDIDGAIKNSSAQTLSNKHCLFRRTEWQFIERISAGNRTDANTDAWP